MIGRIGKTAPFSLGRGAFLALVLFQGFHELEHIIQVLQRYVLGIPNGNGLIGSLADIEPVHFAYNSFYLALLLVAYVGLGLRREPRRYGVFVFIGLTAAVGIQSWHEIEHVLKFAQYLTLHVNGTGGIFGDGPGGIVRLVPVPILHFVYNTFAYLPAVLAFFRLRGQSDAW